MRKAGLLERYWVRVENAQFSEFGITAYSERDLRNIINAKIGTETKILEIREIESIDDLEQNHVIPNIDEFVTRGIWYPIGFR